MNRIFDMDNPLWRFLGKLADLMILNILFLLCSIPIFTIGASLTGVYYVCLKIKEQEEGYIVRNFFKSFKQNFVQSTIIWLIMLALGLLLGTEFYMYRDLSMNNNFFFFFSFSFTDTRSKVDLLCERE